MMEKQLIARLKTIEDSVRTMRQEIEADLREKVDLQLLHNMEKYPLAYHELSECSAEEE